MSIRPPEPKARPRAAAAPPHGNPTSLPDGVIEERPTQVPEIAPATQPAPEELRTQVAAAAADGSPSGPPVAPADPPRKKRNLRRIVLPVIAVVLFVATVVGFNAYRDSVMYVSTDNAQVTGQPVQVGSMNAGQVIAVNEGVGSFARKGQVVAQVVLPTQVGAGPNGAPKLGFLGTGDSRADVTSPIDGVVIATPGAIGSSVAAGDPILTMVDPTQLWVNANIDETDIGRVQVGQYVQVHVDALGTDVSGTVQAITPATAATFSLLPQNNTSGNFNKVTQLVPVQIAVSFGNAPSLLGTSAEVKIQVDN